MSDDTDRNDESADSRREPTRSGRALLLVVFVAVVAVAGGFGYFVGSIGPRALGPIAVAGVVVFRPTPVGMASYGMLVTSVVLGLLFLAAQAASRRERSSGDER